MGSLAELAVDLFADFSTGLLVENSIGKASVVEAYNLIEIDFVENRIAWIPGPSFGDNSVVVAVANMGLEIVEFPC